MAVFWQFSDALGVCVGFTMADYGFQFNFGSFWCVIRSVLFVEPGSGMGKHVANYQSNRRTRV